jgi:hypothetical protein
MSEVGPRGHFGFVRIEITPRSVADLLFYRTPSHLKRSRRASLWSPRLDRSYRTIWPITRRLVEFLPARGRADLPGYALASSAGSLEGKEP